MNENVTTKITPVLFTTGKRSPSRKGPLERVRKWWRSNPGLVIWCSVLLLIALISAIGPYFLVSPDAQEPVDRLQGPSAAHLLGTDEFGRDILSRVVFAGRISLGLGAGITIVAVVLGTALGMIAGYYRSASAVVMRVMDALMAFPALVLAIALVAALSSQSGALAEAIALTVVYTPYVARVVRSRTISLAERGFVTAARAGGVRGSKILLVHVLPNALPTILVQAAFVYASTLLADASLSFLGLGVAPPTPTWGNMIADARPHIDTLPLYIIAPGIAIVLAVMAFNLAGDGIRTMIDPRARAILHLQTLQRRLRRSLTNREGTN